MKKDHVKILDLRKPKKTSGFIFGIVRFISKIVISKNDTKFIYHYDKKKYKNKQVCILADHSCRNQFYFTLAGWNGRPTNILVGWQNFFDKSLYYPLQMFGAIPKLLFSPDPLAVKNSLKIMHNGGSLLIYPEGIQSVNGSTSPINPATFKLIKKLDCDIILCTSNGSYLANPRVSSSFKKGNVEVHYHLLATKDELAELTIEELYERYLKLFPYNDFTWNKEKQYSYIGKYPNAYGFETLYYECPVCHKQECIEYRDGKLVCSNCGMSIYLDEKYNIVTSSKLPFETLDKWYLMQRETVRKEISKPNFKAIFDVQYEEIDAYKLHKAHDKCIPVGKGKLVFTKDNLQYIGTIHNEEVIRTFDYSVIPSGFAILNEGFEFYDGRNYVQFGLLNHHQLSSKLVLYLEELHNLKDPVWKSCWEDVNK